MRLQWEVWVRLGDQDKFFVAGLRAAVSSILYKCVGSSYTRKNSSFNAKYLLAQLKRHSHHIWDKKHATFAQRDVCSYRLKVGFNSVRGIVKGKADIDTTTTLPLAWKCARCQLQGCARTKQILARVKWIEGQWKYIWLPSKYMCVVLSHIN